MADVYWEERGRRSVDAVIIAAGLLALGVVELNFWLGLGWALGHLIWAW